MNYPASPPIEDPTLHPRRRPRTGNGGVRPQRGEPVKYFAVILAIALGVAVIVYGGHDDSPGAQLIGVLLIVGAGVLGVRMVRRSR